MSEDTQTRLGGLTQGSVTSPLIQLYGTVSTTALAPGIVPFTTYVPQATQNGHGSEAGCTRLWRVRADAIEVMRNANNQPPLTVPAIQAEGDGGSRGGSGIFKLRVKACSMGTSFNFTMDLGQPIELYAANINVDVLGPANAFRVNTGNSANTLSGLLVDTLVSPSILEQESPTGNIEVKFTQHLAVAAAAQATIVVPRSAIAVHIFTGTGAATTTWGRFLGTPALPGIRVGNINFAAGLSTEESAPIGDETHLQTDLDALFDRSFTIVWTIRP